MSARLIPKKKTKRLLPSRHPGGRPTAYKAEYAEQARKLCLLGATDKMMADFFNVSEVTLYAWKKKQPEFLKALTRGKMFADAEIASSLYHRARGYSHEAVKIFMPQGRKAPVYAPYVEHYPPDTPAAALWLKNRHPDLWRDRQDINHAGQDGAPLQIANIQVVIVDPKKEDQALIEGDYERVN